MLKSMVCGICLTCAVFLFGCNSQPVEKLEPGQVSQSVAATEDTLKPRLESIGKTGQMSSAMAGVKEAIERLEDRDLSEDLMKDLAEMQKPNVTEREIRAIAKRMAARL